MTTAEDPALAASCGGSDPGRRAMLAALPLGMLAGAGLTWGTQWAADRVSAGPLNVSGVELRRYLGSDLKGARTRALTFWQQWHGATSGKCVDLAGAGPGAAAGASGTCVDRFTPQTDGGTPEKEFEAIRSALRAGGVDLAVLDAQYLAACRGLVARIDSIGPRDLREQGIPGHMVDACQFGDALYGLPLNADAPMLVVNRALAPDADKSLAAAAAKAQRDKAPRGFWEELVRQAGPQRRIGLELGDYEGGTVVLLELLTACGLASVFHRG